MDPERLKDARWPLTQTELAERAGVSRALVGALEQGRHVPSVDAALRIAGALGTTVEALFGRESDPARRAAVPVVGDALDEGRPVRVGEVAGRLVAAPLADDEWAAPDGIAEGGGVRLASAARFRSAGPAGGPVGGHRAAAGAVPAGLVVAGCDPALGIASGLLGTDRLVAVAATSGEALAALRDDRCHGALVHGPRLEPPDGVRRFSFARWRAGVAYERSLGDPSLEALFADVPLVRRPASAATQQAVDRAARRLGASRGRHGPTARSHVEAARRAGWDRCAAVTIEPVAARLGLGFHELEEHEVELWVDARWTDHAGLAALVDLLGSAAFRDRLAAMPGYDVSRSGVAA